MRLNSNKPCYFFFFFNYDKHLFFLWILFGVELQTKQVILKTEFSLLENKCLF